MQPGDRKSSPTDNIRRVRMIVSFMPAFEAAKTVPEKMKQYSITKHFVRRSIMEPTVRWQKNDSFSRIRQL